MSDRQFVPQYRIEPLAEKWLRHLIIWFRECAEHVLPFSLLFFIINCNLVFAQEFQLDSLLLERKTVAKNDSVDILVIKKVFVTTKYLSNETNSGGLYEGYSIKSEYWLFWNNNVDSLRISVNGQVQGNNFNISFRKLQNKINAVVLEFSEIIDPSIFRPSTHRVFQIINLDTKSLLFYTKEAELMTLPNGGAHGNYRLDIDTYCQKYSLTFDINDNITLTHIYNEVHRGMGKLEKKKTMPKRFYILTYEKDKIFYLRKYDN